jgi:stage V sporulation protein G
MEITKIRVKLVKNKDARLRAFCSITFSNEFVVHDIKVIEGTDGYFVAMPSRKVGDHCGKCSGKNHLKARFCNYCGVALPEGRVDNSPKGRAKLHADIAHPITAKCRHNIQQRVLQAFKNELAKPQGPDCDPPDMQTREDDTA